MNPSIYRRVGLFRHQPSEPAESDFRIVQVAIPQPERRQILVRNIYLSLDPDMRGCLRDAKSYAAPVEIGEVITGFFFSSRRRHTRCLSDWSSDVCSSD